MESGWTGWHRGHAYLPIYCMITWHRTCFSKCPTVYVVDNNISLSPRTIQENTDGGAYLHNIFSGDINRLDDQRYTPYHLNHSTEVKGIRTITEGDHRFFNNIFIGGDNSKLKYGMIVFDVSQRPIYAENNLFLNGSLPMTNKTQDWVEKAVNPKLKVEETPTAKYIW